MTNMKKKTEHLRQAGCHIVDFSLVESHNGQILEFLDYFRVQTVSIYKPKYVKIGHLKLEFCANLG
jgi:hypothetical protein